MVTLSNKQSNPVDVHVGCRVRLRRNEVSMSQQQLAARLGITFQQVQKYEKGMNRVGASRLQAISSVLGVPVSYFFEEAPQGTSSVGILQFEPASTPPMGREGLELLRAFARISNPDVRRRVIELIRALADE